MSLARDARIALSLARTSVAAQMQYRADFILELVMAAFWVAWNVAPMWVVYELRDTVAGFNREQAMLVISSWLVLKAILDGLVTPNLVAVVEHIRQGTLDFILLKPADSQLLISAARVVPSKLIDMFAGGAIAVWSLSRLDHTPSAGDVALGALMLLSGAAMLYAIFLMVICSAFWVVRIDNLSYLFLSIFDAARWPIGVFRGWVRLMLTFVVPIAVMTSYPALAALGLLSARGAVGALCGAAVMLFASRRIWLWALGHYSSASS